MREKKIDRMMIVERRKCQKRRRWHKCRETMRREARIYKEFSFTAQTRKRANEQTREKTHTRITHQPISNEILNQHTAHRIGTQKTKEPLSKCWLWCKNSMELNCAVWVCALWKFVIRFRTNEHSYNLKLVNTCTFVLDQMKQETEAPRERERLKQLVQ